MSNTTRKIIKNNNSPPPLVYPRARLQYLPVGPPSNNNTKRNLAGRTPIPLARLRAALLAQPGSPAGNPFNIALHGQPARPVARLLHERPSIPSDPNPLIRLLMMHPPAPPPPPPPLVRTPSMVFGSTTTVEEILPRVQAYIDRFFTGSPHTLTANEFISYYEYTDVGHARGVPLDRFLSLIPEIPRSELNKIQDIIASGSYGSVHKSSDPSKVIKEVIFEEDPYGLGLTIDYFAETLIQFIIQTDETYGSAVPAIHNIYRDNVASRLYIVMDKLDESLDGRLIADGRVHGLARFSLFKDLMIQLLRILIHLNATYGFVHRDLKGNNIMLKGADIKLIDFGFSVMNFVNAEGTTFRLAASHSFPIKSPCRFRQDIGQLFVYLNEYRHRLDQRTIRFLAEILPVGLRSRGYRQMYNKTGAIMGCPTTAVLDPIRALEQLESFNGGRRRRRQGSAMASSSRRCRTLRRKRRN